MYKKILITGGSGLLGLNWAVHLRDSYSMIVGIHSRNINVKGVESIPILLDSIDDVLHSLDEVKPDIVIHSAGLASVEKCEKDPGLAYKVNVLLAQNIASACANKQISFVHISTDHLFSGNEKLIDEECIPRPLNTYGKTKAAAENEIQKINPDALIIRTNFYGWGTTYRQSFSDVIINSLRKNIELNLFQDVYYTPIDISSLVDAVMELIELKKHGIFNVVGDDRLSKYDFGMNIADFFALDKGLIKAINFSAQQGLVNRPLDMSLTNNKVVRTLGRNLGNITEQLNKLYLLELDGTKSEILKI